MHTIENRQEQISALYHEVALQETKKQRPAREPSPYNTIALDDRALLDVATHAKNGAKFAALWRGDTSGYKSASEADQALCDIVAFYCGNDANRIDRLFRDSGLYREERWDRNARSGETYGEGTIARAIDITTDIYRARAWQQEDEPEEQAKETPNDLAAALRRIAELEQENTALKQELRYIRKVDAIPSKTESVSQKATLKGIYRAIEGRSPDTEDGYYRLEPWRIGIWEGQSPQTVRDNISFYSDEIPVLQKKLVRVPDEEAPLGFRHETYIKPTDLFYRPEKHQLDAPPRDHGGKRIICPNPECGSDCIERRVILTCKVCGEPISDTRTDLNKESQPDNVQSQVDFTDSEPLSNEIQPENPTPCEVNLTGYVTHTVLQSQVDFTRGPMSLFSPLIGFSLTENGVDEPNNIPAVQSFAPYDGPYPPPQRLTICCKSTWRWDGEEQHYVCVACHPPGEEHSVGVQS